VAGFINANFLPVEAHIKEHPAWFHRFDANWTPTVLVLDSKGAERYRIEGYLPRDEFQAQLEMALGRIAFKEMRWDDAERFYDTVIQQFPSTKSVPEARYWRAVSHYKGTNDHGVLSQVAKELQQTSPQSIWAEKASPWLGH
jgi:TolA-binding protein